MKLVDRRTLLHLGAAAGMLPALPHSLQAETYPSRPVRLLVGFAAGGITDILARLISQSLSERLGQQFIVENRVGAGSNLATEAVAKSPPDGYTLLQISAANAINTTLYRNLNFDFIRDIVPVAAVMRVPGVMVVHPSMPALTLPEFVTYAKSNPGKINMASGGNGSTPHIYGELFKMMAGVDLQHVPYRGGAPALIDLLSGQVHVMFDTLPTSLEHIRTHKLRPLAVTTMTRVEVLPEVPTVGDFLPGYEASGWQGLGAPKGTPGPIVDRLNAEINTALDGMTMKDRLAQLGGLPIGGSAAEFSKLISDETEKWARVVKFSGARAD